MSPLSVRTGHWSGLFLTDKWTSICTALGSSAQSAFAADLLGEPLPGLFSRTLGDTCLQKFLVSPPGPAIPQAPYGPAS